MKILGLALSLILGFSCFGCSGGSSPGGLSEQDPESTSEATPASVRNLAFTLTNYQTFNANVVEGQILYHLLTLKNQKGDVLYTKEIHGYGGEERTLEVPRENNTTLVVESINPQKIVIRRGMASEVNTNQEQVKVELDMHMVPIFWNQNSKTFVTKGHYKVELFSQPGVPLKWGIYEGALQNPSDVTPEEDLPSPDENGYTLLDDSSRDIGVYTFVIYDPASGERPTLYVSVYDPVHTPGIMINSGASFDIINNSPLNPRIEYSMVGQPYVSFLEPFDPEEEPPLFGVNLVEAVYYYVLKPLLDEGDAIRAKEKSEEEAELSEDSEEPQP